jgi:ribosome-binding factor A
MEILQKAQGYIRGEIGRRIRVRYTPEVTFKLDKSIAQGSKVISLMEKVKNEESDQSE